MFFWNFRTFFEDKQNEGTENCFTWEILDIATTLSKMIDAKQSSLMKIGEEISMKSGSNWVLVENRETSFTRNIIRPNNSN